MKYLSLALFSILFLSCNKNEQPPSVSCDVNGVNWSPTSVSVSRSHETDLFSFRAYDDTLSILFKIAADGESQYELSPSSEHKVFVDLSHPPFIKSYSINNYSSYGAFIINEIKGFDKLMNGTFSFSAYTNEGEKINVSNGKFSDYSYIK